MAVRPALLATDEEHDIVAVDAPPKSIPVARSFALEGRVPRPFEGAPTSSAAHVPGDAGLFVLRVTGVVGGARLGLHQRRELLGGARATEDAGEGREIAPRRFEVDAEVT